MRNHCFKHIFLEETLYEYIYREKQYNLIEKLVEKIEVFYLNSLKKGKSYSNIIRSVKGKNTYKIRYSPSERIPFKIYENDDLELCLILGNIQNHQEGVKLHQQQYKFTQSQELIENDLTEAEDILISSYEYEFSYIGRIWSQEEEQRLQQNVKAELLRVLNKAQQSFLEQSGPILLRGTAGSGKTTVSIYRLLKSSTINKIYVTYTSGLKEYAKKIFDSLTVGLDVQPMEFITVEELLLSLIAGSHNFAPSQKITFDIFKSLPFIEKAVQQHKIEPYIIWEEIRGVLKQCPQKITRKEYLAQTEDPKIGNTVYDIYHKYVNYLQTHQMWDDIDLAKASLAEITNNKSNHYEEIIVDEAQDLTKIHFQVLTNLVYSPDGLFFAGDESQAIHPSKFQWQEVEKIIYQTINNKIHKLSNINQSLKENYRTPETIFHLAKVLKNWRCELMKEKNDFTDVITHKKGGDKIQLIEPKYFNDFQIDIAPTHVMIIIASEQYKEEARQKFGTGSVLTIAEAKGLENQDIVLYRFFDEQHINHSFQRLLYFFNIASKARDYITLLNLLHVAITRAENRLFIISNNSNVRLLEPLKIFNFDENNGEELKEILQGKEKNYEKYFAWANKLELSGALEQAEANYTKSASLGHPQGYAYMYKCRGLLAKLKHNYEEAVKNLELALTTDEEKVLYEFWECQGLLALEKGDLDSAIKYFRDAEIPTKNIVQRLCSTNHPKRYDKSIGVIAKYQSAYLDEFINKSEINSHISLTIENFNKISQDLKLTEIFYKNRLNLSTNLVNQSQSQFFQLKRRIEALRNQFSREVAEKPTDYYLKVEEIENTLQELINNFDNLKRIKVDTLKNILNTFILLDLDKKEKLQNKFQLYYHFILINSIDIIIAQVADFELQTINTKKNKLEKELNKLIYKISKSNYYQIRHLLLNSQYLTSTINETINKQDKKDTRFLVWQLAYNIRETEGYPTNKRNFLDKCLKKNISTNEALIYFEEWQKQNPDPEKTEVWEIANEMKRKNQYPTLDDIRSKMKSNKRVKTYFREWTEKNPKI